MTRAVGCVCWMCRVRSINTTLYLLISLVPTSCVHKENEFEKSAHDRFGYGSACGCLHRSRRCFGFTFLSLASITGPPNGPILLAGVCRCLSSAVVVVCNAAGVRAGRPPGSWTCAVLRVVIGRPTLQNARRASTVTSVDKRFSVTCAIERCRSYWSAIQISTYLLTYLFSCLHNLQRSLCYFRIAPCQTWTGGFPWDWLQVHGSYYTNYVSVTILLLWPTLDPRFEIWTKFRWLNKNFGWYPD